MRHAAQTWSTVDKSVQQCLADHEGMVVDNLIQQYISATDSRVRPAIEACTQIVAQEQQQAAIQAQQQQAAMQAEAQRRAEEEQRAEQGRQARLASLTQRFGATRANTILSGQVVTGMTPTEVRESLGQPAQVEQLTATDAIWHYANARIYFSNNQVVGVRHMN